MRKWEKKWDTSGPFAKFTWFPCTLVQTRKFVPLGEIDASVQASMSGALLMRTRSALSLAERRAVELSLRDQQQQQQQQQRSQQVVESAEVDESVVDAPEDGKKKRRRTAVE